MITLTLTDGDKTIMIPIDKITGIITCKRLCHVNTIDDYYVFEIEYGLVNDAISQLDDMIATIANDEQVHVHCKLYDFNILPAGDPPATEQSAVPASVEPST